MFHDVLLCLASRATNGVAASGRRSRQRRRDRRQLRRNRRQLRRNRRQLRRNRRWRRRDRRYRRERDPMLNSVLNGDWSNSVPGRKIPEGAVDTHLRLLDRVVSDASFLSGGVFACDLAHRHLFQYYVCCTRSGVTRCTLYTVLFLCRMCLCGLYAAL